MPSALLLILLCVLSGVAALFGIAIQALRHRDLRGKKWLLLPLGVLFSFPLVVARIGFAEGVWGTTHPMFLLLVAVGVIGVACQVAGWRAILRPRLGPSQCLNCGYDMKGLPGCPECGEGRADRPAP